MSGEGAQRQRRGKAIEKRGVRSEAKIELIEGLPREREGHETVNREKYAEPE